jgi:hypothetical protein
MQKIGTAAKRTAKVLALAAVLGASVYGLLGSAAGLAQAHSALSYDALPTSID